MGALVEFSWLYDTISVEINYLTCTTKAALSVDARENAFHRVRSAILAPLESDIVCNCENLGSGLKVAMFR